MSVPTEPTTQPTLAGAVPAPRTEADLTAVRPFEVHVPEEQLADLRRRLAATRWPTRELVPDREQGVQLATMQELTRYWATDHDWRRCEARLNALPQFMTEIDEILFRHVDLKGADCGMGLHRMYSSCRATGGDKPRRVAQRSQV